ncbi:hypothetical protein Hanom_Chr14g01269321 [Helianthus anomalus]
MADALEAAYNDSLPAYADLMDKVNEDGIDSLRLMLDPEEDRRSYKQWLFDIFRRLDAADGLVRLQVLVTEDMIRGDEVPPDDVLPRVSRSCKSIIYQEPSHIEANTVVLSADTLMKSFPADSTQRGGLVYERRRGDRSGKKLVDGQEVMAALVNEKDANVLVVDPHRSEYHG